MNKGLEPRLFFLARRKDATGISGTGRVLDGVVFHTGQVVVCWRSDVNRPGGHSSIAIFPSWEAFLQVHVESHPENEAEIHWLSQE